MQVMAFDPDEMNATLLTNNVSRNSAGAENIQKGALSDSA